MGEEAMMGRPLSEVYLTDLPITFELVELDQDTKVVALVVQAGFGPPGSGRAETYVPIRIMLTAESQQALLEDLQKLEALLLKARSDNTTPHSVQ